MLVGRERERAQNQLEIASRQP